MRRFGSSTTKNALANKLKAYFRVLEQPLNSSRMECIAPVSNLPTSSDVNEIDVLKSQMKKIGFIRASRVKRDWRVGDIIVLDGGESFYSVQLDEPKDALTLIVAKLNPVPGNPRMFTADQACSCRVSNIIGRIRAPVNPDSSQGIALRQFIKVFGR